jgi:hypothetical protein
MNRNQERRFLNSQFPRDVIASAPTRSWRMEFGFIVAIALLCLATYLAT